MSRAIALCVGMLSAVFTQVVCAQHVRAESRFRLPDVHPQQLPDSLVIRDNTGALVFAGLAGGAVGALLLTGAAYAIAPEPEECDDCEGPGAKDLAAAVGVLIGEAAGLSLAVHFANGRYGNFGKELFMAAGTIALMVPAAFKGEPSLIFAVPVIQLILVIREERAAEKRAGIRRQ
jgi:hypothetical protein